MNLLLSTADAALQLGCSTERVRQLVLAGKLKPFGRTVSGIRVFSSEEVERLAQERSKAKEEMQQAKAA